MYVGYTIVPATTIRMRAPSSSAGQLRALTRANLALGTVLGRAARSSGILSARVYGTTRVRTACRNQPPPGVVLWFARMKLFIQIPCLNEEETLPATLADLPREVEGFTSVEWLVIDDGSTDRTVAVARENGVDHIVRLTNNKGLAAGFQAGLDACLKLGADVIVNTDADNQYFGGDIPKLVAPILDGDADMVVGDRGIDDIDHFSPLKKRLQRLGSWVVRQASETNVPDTTSGFRAYNREAALQLAVVSKFTYTLESIIQAGKLLVAIDDVKIGTNPKTRESRLFPSMWSYVRRNSLSIFRIYAQYEPMRVFFALALAARRPGDGPVAALGGRLGAGRRRRPRAVPDLRRGPLQRGGRDGRARRHRRPAARPADDDPAGRSRRSAGSSCSSTCRPRTTSPARGRPATPRRPARAAPPHPKSSVSRRRSRRRSSCEQRHRRQRGHRHGEHVRQVRLHEPGRPPADDGVPPQPRRALGHRLRDLGPRRRLRRGRPHLRVGRAPRRRPDRRHRPRRPAAARAVEGPHPRRTSSTRS